MSGFFGPTPSADRASVVKRPASPGDQLAGDLAHRIVAAALDGAVVRLRHGFAGVRRAGLEHCKVLKPAYPK